MHDPVLAQVLLEQLIALNILPLRMGGRDAADQTGEMRFRLLGFEFQPLSDTGRDMFVKVTACPTGWTARPMIFGKRIWSEVLDARGRVRALLFYSVGQVGLGARPPLILHRFAAALHDRPPA